MVCFGVISGHGRAGGWLLPVLVLSLVTHVLEADYIIIIRSALSLAVGFLLLRALRSVLVLAVGINPRDGEWLRSVSACSCGHPRDGDW